MEAMTQKIAATVLDGYYRDLHESGRTSYKITGAACMFCDVRFNLADAPKKCEWGDSNLGKVIRLRGLIRAHLREHHALQIALSEQEKSA